MIFSFILLLPVFSGFVECLTRVSCLGGMLGETPRTSVRHLFRIMDLSGGKIKLNKETRKTAVSYGSFIYN